MPLFQKGQVNNPKGRPKGSKDKINYNVGSICKSFNFNPFEQLIKLAQTGKDRIKLEASAELASYLAPKLRSIEVTAEEAIEKFQLIFNVGNQPEENNQPDGIDNLQCNAHSNGVPSQ